ncbi:MAG: histidine kinase N-terminal 7TM domain-containing protein [Anaerolineae bacterium]
MYWTFGGYVFPLLCAALMMATVGILVLRRRHTPGAGPFALLSFAVVLWSLGNILEIGCVRFEDKLFWANVEYFGIALIPMLFLVFAAQYTTSGNRPYLSELILLAIIPAGTAILVWGDPVLGLVRRDLALVHVGDVAVLSKTFGPWFWVNAVYAYGVLAGGSVLLIRRQLREGGVLRRQALSVIVGALFPWIANALYISLRSPADYLDPTPMFCALSGAALALGLFRFGLFDIVPSARDAVIEGLPDGIIVFDSVGRMVDANPAARALLGAEWSKVVGKVPSDTLRSALGVPHEGNLGRETVTQVSLGEGDERRYYESRISPLLNRHKHVAGRTLTLRDVTLQKTLEERLRQSQTMEAIGTLAGGVAHHFNNLLTVINGYSQLLLTGMREDDALRHEVEVIHNAGSRAAEITRRLLIFSRNHSPGEQVSSINDIVGGMSDMLVLLIGEKVELRIELCPEVGRVRVDPRLVEQVITHLVANARDAMPDGGILTIATGDVPTHTAGDSGKSVLRSVSLTVRDTGVGMTEDVKAHLFEPFFTTKGLARGTGLGLSTVYGIVQQCGGSIRVQSQPGQGSAFHITIPCVEGADAVPDAMVVARSVAARDVTVLVVEDEASVLRLVHEVLDQAGYRVLCTPSGEDAIAVCRQFRGDIDLLLADVVMPEMGGLEVARQIAMLRPTTRVLYMTGKLDLQDAGSLEAGDGTFVLAKPFTVAELVHAVARVLGRDVRACAGVAEDQTVASPLTEGNVHG